MRSLTQVLMLTLALMIVAPPTQAQVRSDINDPNLFTSAQRTELFDLMIQYIDGPVLEEHCVMTMITGVMIHGDFDFLPFHRTYLEGMEDFLISQGHPEFVPLPKWDPSTPAPTEFQFGGPNSDGIDPDCSSFTCDPQHLSASCSWPIDWNPNVSLPAFLDLPVVAGPYNDLCDWPMNPITPTAPGLPDCCADGLSRVIEGQGPNPVNSGYHNSVHGIMGGVMGNFRSPAAPIFWLWHAYVDDIWKRWEEFCPSSTTAAVDLYMKDTPKEVESERDRGEEPNIDNDPMWLSEDIWVRRQNDGIANQENENPDHFTTPGLTNYIYVRVRNRGYAPSTGTEKITLNWAKAATALSWPSHWDGSITAPALMGDQIAVHTLPVIQPGSSHIEVFQWNAPDPAIYAAVGTDPIFWANEPWHFCLLARIETSPSAPFGMSFPETADLNGNVNKNNNIVWKNISVIDIAGLSGGGGWEDDKLVGASVLVGDAWGQDGRFNLVFKDPDHFKGNPVTAEAEVRVTLDEPLWEAWQNGGGKMSNLAISREDRHQLIVTGSPAILKNIKFPPGKRYLADVSFNFLAEQMSGQPIFDYDFIQTDRYGKAVGGERYHVIVPGREVFHADAGPDKAISPNATADLSAYTIGEAAIYNWYDPQGELIYTGTDLTVSPEVTSKYKLEVIAESDGVKDYDEVEVKIKEHEVISIAPNPTTGNTLVSYRLTNANSAYLMLTMPYSGVNNQYILDVQSDHVQLNVDDLPPGTYSLILVVDGVASDVDQITVL